MTTEVIATFLPQVVVDSLVAALDRAGLMIGSLTLEPIAASTVAVPEAMRGLNLAMVDIGAGTSDIAITAKGTITGYAMVPSAGDEITEALANELLLDFNTSEKVKRQLLTKKEIKFTDIVGQKRTISANEVKEIIKPAVTELAKQIATTLNNKAPQAVLAVGGGSLTPGLSEELANHLEISPERVAVRGREVLTDISGARSLKGPQAITPIGIAVTALRKEGLGIAWVRVNGRPIHFLTGQEMTVTEALLAARILARQLYGQPGKGLGVEINGKLHFLRGQPGKLGTVLVNGSKADLDTVIQNGDKIEVIPGKNGTDAKGTIGDILPKIEPLSFTFNGRQFSLEPVIYMNGKQVVLNTPLEDQACITVEKFDTVAKVLVKIGESTDKPVFLNGKKVRKDTVIKNGDNLSTEIEERVTITINGEKTNLNVKGSNIVFADLFNYLDFPKIPPTGCKKLVMEVNGQPAQFITPLKNNDDITLRQL